MTQDKINKAVENLKQLIIDEKEHQKKYGGASRAIVCAYNRSALMIEQFAPEILKSLLQSDNETLYTRKQLQEACKAEYERGLQDAKVVESYDEYLKSNDDGRGVIELVQDNSDILMSIYACPSDNCKNHVCEGDNYCDRCGQKLIWPDNQKKGEEG